MSLLEYLAAIKRANPMDILMSQIEVEEFQNHLERLAMEAVTTKTVAGPSIASLLGLGGDFIMLSYTIDAS
jgi:hypothetical protein